eukprot:scaffold28263_cov101-Isochrysis_galbana.AAC.2
MSSGCPNIARARRSAQASALPASQIGTRTAAGRWAGSKSGPSKSGRGPGGSECGYTTGLAGCAARNGLRRISAMLGAATAVGGGRKMVRSRCHASSRLAAGEGSPRIPRGRAPGAAREAYAGR